MAKIITVSIIIVNYKVEKELFDCLTSIKKSNPKTPYEIIVVDNSEKNVGYGAGNNLGAKKAKGEYLFFLNPDTLVEKGAVDVLVSFLQQNKNAGIVAPLLLDPNKKPYPLQATTTLTPLTAIVCLSFINKLFPTNPIAKKYWLMSWNKKEEKEVDVMPGTAFMIRKSLFDDIGRFDERFFLFFEENDLCMRVQKLGYKIYVQPQAKVVHLWGRSTKSLENTKEIFKKSRFLYFQKYYGTLWARVVAMFCR